MYTNIPPAEGIANIKRLLEGDIIPIPSNFPKDEVIKLLSEVLLNNVFTFGDTYWLQIAGTAMGTSLACAYATLFFGLPEETILINKYRPWIILWKRFIDDRYLLWRMGNTLHERATRKNAFTNLCQDIDTCTNLK